MGVGKYLLITYKYLAVPNKLMSLLSDPTCPQIRDMSELVTLHTTTSPDSAYVLYWRRLVHLHLRTVVKCDTHFLTLPPNITCPIYGSQS